MSISINSHIEAGFGARLEKIRERRKLTRVALAELAGTHYDTVLKLERGIRSPGLALMCKLADALDVKVAALLKG